MLNTHIPSFRVWNAQAVSGTTTYRTLATVVTAARDVSYLVDVTGTPAGTLSIEVSNASNDDVTSGIDKWTSYDAVNVASTINGAATTFGIELSGLTFGRVRLKYINATGSGTVTAIVTTKAN